MKRTLLALLVAAFTGLNVTAQIAYSPFLDSIIQLADENSVMLLTRQLAGDTSVTVDGQTYTITSRHYNNQGNSRAADFIFSKFVEYGYTPEIHTFSNGRGENVIATKIGTKYPEKEFIICGHYDNMPSGNNSPGADDNASGTVAVMEAARLFANLDFDYTIRFAAWDEEEIGLVGSYAYAQRASNLNLDIIGVLNLDMIAWDSNNNFVYTIATNTLSQAFTNDFISTTKLYQPVLNHNYYYTTASDHASFWQFDYPAMLVIEDWYDFNAYYHTPGDDIDILNVPYYLALLRASIANIGAQAWDQRVYINHDPVVSGNSTGPREAVFQISSNQVIDVENFPPRLYYSANGGEFEFVEPTDIYFNYYTFQIPGFPMGTEVRYYIAVQDSAARLVATLPAGGKGINPPGSISPGIYYNYMVDNIFSVDNCSVTTPLAIADNDNTYDYITVTSQGTVLDLNVAVDITHSRTGDLRLILTGPTGSVSLLSDRNGGNGDNYTQTTFDDQATVTIKEGTPPYTGRFRPEMALSTFNNKPMNGTWTFRINDGAINNTGTFNSWCLHFQFRDISSSAGYDKVSNKEVLSQNYPNPTQGITNIEFTLDKPEDISLAVYNHFGQEVAMLAKGRYEAGNHLIVAGLKNLSSGRYVYRLITGNGVFSKPPVIVK